MERVARPPSYKIRFEMFGLLVEQTKVLMNLTKS